MEEKDNLLLNDQKFPSFKQLPEINNNGNLKNNDNKNYFKLTSTIIKSEEKRRKLSQDISENSIENLDSKNTNHITFLIIIILIMFLCYFNKKRLILLKKNYLSNCSFFRFNIFYSNPNNCFLLFVILICINTLSSGLKLIILQSLTYLVCFIIILIKNKINNEQNFQKAKIFFHCSDIIISFLYLGEKIRQISEEKSLNKIIRIILLIFNINIVIYFILVEIVNCSYDKIIIDILFSILVSITVFYSIFYIMKLKIKPKKIIFIILNNIILYSIIFMFFHFFFFFLCYYFQKLQYFFVSKILMKKIGFLIYVIFELNLFFSNNIEGKNKLFYLNNIYSNRYLYSYTNYIKTILRVLIAVIVEHYLLSKLDFYYKENFILIKCFCIICFDILHSFLVLFLVKIIFNFMHLNNTSLLDVDINKPFIRYGSFVEGKEKDPLFYIE